jgi:hypothetical protein
MDELTVEGFLSPDEWKRLKEIVLNESREAAVEYLKRHFVTGDAALACIELAEGQLASWFYEGA